MSSFGSYDITFCSDECNKKECFRHPDRIAKRSGFYSFANLKNTSCCPYRGNNQNKETAKE